MGSSNFETIVYGIKDMQEAYASAVDEALYSEGHDPYNGTISTTDGVVLSPLSTGKPVPENEINWSAVSERLDHLSKWEECEALSIHKVTPAQHERLGETTMDIRIPSDTSAEDRDKVITAEAEKQLRRWAREGVSVKLEKTYSRPERKITLDKSKKYAVEPAQWRITNDPKVVTRASKGKTETRFFILPVHHGNRPQTWVKMPRWEDGYTSQADARAALPTPPLRGWIGDRRLLSPQEWEVISMTRRVGGTGLVEHSVDHRGTRKTMSLLVSVKIDEVVSEAKKNPNEIGWLFYGWAAC